MKIETMWCVRDPGPDSELRDICFRIEPKDLVAITAGLYSAGLVDRVRQMEGLVAYSDEAEARADAESRLAARDASAAALMSTGTCRVWELFGGQVRLYESGHVQHWDIRANRWYDGPGSRDCMSGEDARRHGEWKAAADAYRIAAPHSPTSTGP